MIQVGLAALASCDIDSDDAAALGEETEQIMHAVGGLQMQAARRLSRFIAQGGPAADGSPSLAAWLGQRCRLRPWETRPFTAIAAHLHLLDDTVTAFANGEIGFGDVATIAEGIDRAAETMDPEWSPERIAAAAQPILLGAAAKVTPAQLRRVACRIAMTLDGEDAERRRRQLERQAYLNIGQTIDGAGSLRAEMGAADLAVLEKTVDTFAPLPAADRPRWQNAAGNRRLRGLITACQIALSEAGRHGHRERGGAPVRIHVIASAATVDPDVPATQAPPGRTEYGTIISATEIREMIDRDAVSTSRVHVDADGRVIDRFTADGQPLDWGRTRRFFTAAQREVYLTVHDACAAEGCDRPVAWADIDHDQAWADGGRTDLANGRPLCRWHNLRKEERRSTEASPAERQGEQGHPRGQDAPDQCDERAQPPPSGDPQESSGLQDRQEHPESDPHERRDPPIRDDG